MKNSLNLANVAYRTGKKSQETRLRWLC